MTTDTGSKSMKGGTKAKRGSSVFRQESFGFFCQACGAAYVVEGRTQAVTCDCQWHAEDTHLCRGCRS
jgi:hypothetical protein